MCLVRYCLLNLLSVHYKVMCVFITPRIGAATKEAYVEDSYPCLLHKYLKFDDEMSVVAVVWRDCQIRIDQ